MKKKESQRNYSVPIDEVYKVRAFAYPNYITLKVGAKRDLKNNVKAFDGKGNNVYDASIPHPADNLKTEICDPDCVGIERVTVPTHTIYVRALKAISLTHIRFYPKIIVKEANNSITSRYFDQIYVDLIITIIP